jgi:hypothetical protein
LNGFGEKKNTLPLLGFEPPDLVSRYCVFDIPAPFLPGGYQKSFIGITGLGRSF